MLFETELFCLLGEAGFYDSLQQHRQPLKVCLEDATENPLDVQVYEADLPF